ncbi:MAG: hypothetical protein IJ583_01605, partial [Firmicutes bacterium]|nr:hypothetical protein [Bacillota bacterium]
SKVGNKIPIIISLIVLLFGCFCCFGTIFIALIGSVAEEVETTGVYNEPYYDNRTPIGEVLYDNGGIKITYQGIYENLLSKDIKLFIENNSGKDLIVSCPAPPNMEINGYAISNYATTMYCELGPGQKTNDSISIYDRNLDEQGISTINTIKFRLCIKEDIFSDSKDIYVTLNL